MVLVEFDYLVTKDKIEDGENFKDFLNPVVSRFTGVLHRHTYLSRHSRLQTMTQHIDTLLNAF